VRPGDPAALADVIYEFVRNDPAHMREGIKKTAEAMAWESLTDCILALMGKKDQGITHYGPGKNRLNSTIYNHYTYCPLH
jgi:hypothetical protein